MGYFDQRTGTWNEGMPPGMESLDLATEYARPLNVAFNEAYSTPYSNYLDPNIAVPRQTMSQFFRQDQPEQPAQQQEFIPPTSDAERQQQAYDYRMSQPKTANYVRNNTTGAVQDLPSYQPQQQASPTGQVSGAQATGDMVNNLISLGQRQNIPRDQLSAMVQYQASAQPGSPSAEDLYRQSFQYGTPIKDLIAAHSAVGSGSAAREKERLDLEAKRSTISHTNAQTDKLQRDAMHSERTRTMSPEARLAYEFKNGLIDQGTYETAIAGTPGGREAAKKVVAKEKATAKGVVDQEKRAVDYKTQTGRLDEMLGEIDKLLDPAGRAKDELKAYAGPYDQFTPVVFPTAARGQSALETLRNKLTIRNLSEAKKEADQSFGAMAVKEWPRFENMHAYLDPSTNDKVLAENLREYRVKLQKARNDIDAAYQAKSTGGSDAPMTPAVQAQDAQAAPAAVDRGAVVMQGGVQYPVVSRNPDGSVIIRDPRTGKTGVWRP